MSDETLNEMYRQFRTAQDKYVYFLLTAAGAGIALAVNQTKSEGLQLSQIPLALCIMSWGLSFFSGSRFALHSISAIYTNTKLYLAQQGLDPIAGNHSQKIELACGVYEKSLQKDQEALAKHGRRQFRFLVVGACMYLVWHVLEMWLRSSI